MASAVGEPFRGHVTDGSDGSARGRQPGVAPHRGDTEVDEVREIGLGDDDVVRLDIAMQQPLGMCGIQRGADLTDDGHRPRRFHRPVRDHLVEGLPVHEPHVDVEPAVDLPPVVDGNDVRFLENGRRMGLTLKPLPKRVVVGERVGEDLERDSPVLVGVVRLVHLTHPALAEQADDVVLAERRTDARLHGATP